MVQASFFGREIIATACPIQASASSCPARLRPLVDLVKQLRSREERLHRFWNEGEDVLICKGWASPAYNLEYFLTGIYKSVKSNGGHRPSTFDSAYLLSKYKTEFDTEIPPFVKTVMFPVIRFLGVLADKHKKFEGAPPAVTGEI